jgi:multiple sugar transport system permease protein
MIPQVVLLSKLKIIDTIFSFIILSLFGQGIRGAVFVLLFYSFFKQIPKSIEESAKIDGANAFTIFFRVAVPSAAPAYILTFLLSFVWYYNETVLATLYLGNNMTTLTLQLEVFKSAYEAMLNQSGTTGKSINEAIYMAGTLLTILPLIIIYFITQRFFVEGIDRAGITGE